MRETEARPRERRGEAPANGHAAGSGPSAQIPVDAPGAPESGEETVSPRVVAIQIGDINIVNNYCGQHPREYATMEVGDTMERMETAVDGTTLEGTPKLISMAQAARRSGINRQTIHRALPRIQHVRWEAEEGKPAVVLLYEQSFEEYRASFKHRPKRQDA